MRTSHTRAHVLAASAGIVFALSSVSVLADATAQARRLRHFEILHQDNYFQSMSVANGVPTLVLGSSHADTDLESLGAFCRVIFEYYAELNPEYTQLVVIDGATGTQFATVDASGFHKT